MKKALMHIAIVAILALIIDGAWLAIVMYYPLMTSAHPRLRHTSHLTPADPDTSTTTGCNLDEGQDCQISWEDADQVCADSGHGKADHSKNNKDTGVTTCTDGKTITTDKACQILLGNNTAPFVDAGGFTGCYAASNSNSTTDDTTSNSSPTVIAQSDFQRFCGNNGNSPATFIIDRANKNFTCSNDLTLFTFNDLCKKLIGGNSKATVTKANQDACTPA